MNIHFPLYRVTYPSCRTEAYKKGDGSAAQFSSHAELKEITSSVPVASKE